MNDEYNELNSIINKSIYTSCYCEENVYNLLNSLSNLTKEASSDITNSYAIFISNSSRFNLLFKQRASNKPEEDNWVLWDYHVVILIIYRGKPLIIDRDSLLGNITPLKDYLKETFKTEIFEQVDERIQSPWCRQISRCRIIPIKDFLNHFASDRSHMLIEPISPDELKSLPSTLPNEFHIKPPSYSPIQGILAKIKGEKNNLFSKYLDLRTNEERFEEDGIIRIDEDDANSFGKVLIKIEDLLSEVIFT